MSLDNRQPRRIRVAIVDDHRLVIDGLTAHLRSADNSIEVAIGSTTWAGLLADERFPVEVTVLDLNLEDEIAISAKVRALSAAGSQTVVISRHSDAASIHGAIKAGALAFVPKTDAADELVHAIHAAAEGRPYENRPLTQALETLSDTEDPGLGRQEHRALVLYAAGRSIREVARDMNTTEETVKSYIKRGRRKYRKVGIELGTKVLLRSHGIREGWLRPE